MELLWPWFLLLLGLLPLIAAAYLWTLRRRRRFAVRYSSLALVRAALPIPSRLRRHAPFALFLLSLGGLILALGRPVAVVNAPSGNTTIILALDVSRSMCERDIPPNRLAAAEAAALSFIRDQGPDVQIGVVAFAGFAELIQSPTQDYDLLENAVGSLITGRRTAIGSAILRSIDAIAEVDNAVAPSSNGTGLGSPPTPVPEGVFAADIIVLLTDGASNEGPEPLEAAQQAVDRGVRVYTIGFGTAEGASGAVPFCGEGVESRAAVGGQQFGLTGLRRGIDEGTLKQIADMTGGDYYTAASASELQDVFESLPTSSITRQETLELSVVFAAAGALLASLAFIFALIWNPLP